MTVDSNKEDCASSLIEADEAKKIVESITDSITGGEKQERMYSNIRNNFSLISISIIFIFTHLINANIRGKMKNLII